VIEQIRRRSDRIERIDSLHVVDRAGRLLGYLKLRDLILNHGRTPVAEVMRPDPPAVTRDTDQEAVLDLAKAKGETVIAVVDEERRLLGVIAPRELTEIARREAREDLMLMGNVSPESTGFDSPGQIVRRRLPWLLTGLAGALVTAVVVGAYEETLTQAAILASFIPVVSATAGNASMQASTVTIQALSEHGKLTGGFAARLGREVAGAAMNGTVMGLAIGLALLALSFAVPVERAAQLVATVALAQLLVILVAGTVGTVVPVALDRLGFDPAVATGIFILTVNDVAGVLILFVIATQLYL
jgi:magnesium transporter